MLARLVNKMEYYNSQACNNQTKECNQNLNLMLKLYIKQKSQPDYGWLFTFLLTNNAILNCSFSGFFTKRSFK